jgi:hypothetical protein
MTTIAAQLGWSDSQVERAWSALHLVLAADGIVSERGTELLELAAAQLGVPNLQARAGAAPKLDAQLFPNSRDREALVSVLVVAACIDGRVTLGAEQALRRIATSLAVKSHWVDLLPALRTRNHRAVKWQLAKRSPEARRMLKRVWAEEGLLGIARSIQFVAGFARDNELAAKFRALSGYTPGTFGHAVSEHFRKEGFSLPGARGGMAERMVHHDLMHVLNGYDTTPAGECQLAGFYAGFVAGDAFTFIMIVLATFHLGMNVSPAVVKPANFAFDPAKVLAAYLRGRQVQVDILGQWDYWALMPLRPKAAAAQLGIAA